MTLPSGYYKIQSAKSDGYVKGFIHKGQKVDMAQPETGDSEAQIFHVVKEDKGYVMSGDQVAVEPGIIRGQDVVVWGGHGRKFHWTIDKARTGDPDGTNKNLIHEHNKYWFDGSDIGFDPTMFLQEKKTGPFVTEWRFIEVHPQSQSDTASPIVNQGSPAPTPVPVPQHAVPNGVGRPAISMPHVEVPKADAAPALPNGVSNGVTTSPQPEANGDAATSNPQPKSRNLNAQGHIGIPSNGYLPLTNMSAAALLNSTYIPQNGQHGLSLQQVQNLKSAFATLSATEMAALNAGRPSR